MARNRSSYCVCWPRSKKCCARMDMRSRPVPPWQPRNDTGNRFELFFGRSGLFPFSPGVAKRSRRVNDKAMTDSRQPPLDQRGLIAALRKFLPDEMILRAREDLRPYE